MLSNEVHNNIAKQLHHTKPDEYAPGKDVGMTIHDATALKVVVFPTSTTAIIRYNETADHYDVIYNKQGDPARRVEGVFCEQLGEIVFGEQAKEI